MSQEPTPARKKRSERKKGDRLAATLFCFCFLLICAGCGYTFTGGGQLPENVRLVSVRMPENRSSVTGVEAILANDLAGEVARSPLMKLTDGPGAEAEIKAVVMSAESDSVIHQNQRTVMGRITLVVKVKLVAADGRVLADLGSLSDDEEFDVSSDKYDAVNEKRKAVQEISRRLSEKIYHRLLTGF